MGIQAVSPRIYLGYGIMLEDFSVSMSLGDREAAHIRKIGMGTYQIESYISSYDHEVELSFTLVSRRDVSRYSNRAFQDMVHILRYNPKQIALLGPGWVCKHCGDYNPSGTLICWRCSGEAESIDSLCPVQLNFETTCFSVNGDKPFSDFVTADFQMAGHDVDIDRLGRAIASNSRAITLPNGCQLKPGYYLCEFCGQAVDEGEICPGCGGWRRPMSELLKLNHECVYCGREVTGGIVCPGCGARISGLMLRRWMRNRR